MLLAYIDESYGDEVYWFGAILVPEEADAQLQREILGIPARYAPHGVSGDAELHGYPLWNGIEEWESLEPRLRVDAMRRTVRTIPRAGAQVVFVGVDRYALALVKLDQARAHAVSELLDCLEHHCAAQLAERCLLVFDEETSTSQALIEAVHVHHRSVLLSGVDPRIVERPLMAPSHHTPGIQVADVATYLWRRQHAFPSETDPRAQAARDRLLAVFRGSIAHEQRP